MILQQIFLELLEPNLHPPVKSADSVSYIDLKTEDNCFSFHLTITDAVSTWTEPWKSLILLYLLEPSEFKSEKRSEMTQTFVGFKDRPLDLSWTHHTHTGPSQLRFYLSAPSVQEHVSERRNEAAWEGKGDAARPDVGGGRKWEHGAERWLHPAALAPLNEALWGSELQPARHVK